MLKNIKNFISNFTEKDGDIEVPKIAENSLNKACAVLLIETALADKNFSSEEIVSMKNTLQTTYNIEEKIIEDLIKEAQQLVTESTSLYEHTRLINDSCDYSDKLRLIYSLWTIAFVDKQIDKYEEYLIRKISDLLHVSHSDFIKEKIKVKENI